ncbi:chitin binding peritrophin-A domain-containing protein [uncultured Roseobacter sp.]|uniref:chitin binding peritrophin-A domain-containing protein n=1 Tax=uncultured Roseobacter sp. TaxID=114847 RepID=UPI002626C92D|nr:chitin binding peritrophin-A domain-containing protein [uncultured Roseobacter sp.]
MTIKTLAAAVALTIIPAVSFAAGCSYDKQTTMSCAPGTAYDAQTGTCVTSVNS